MAAICRGSRRHGDWGLTHEVGALSSEPHGHLMMAVGVTRLLDLLRLVLLFFSVFKEVFCRLLLVVFLGSIRVSVFLLLRIRVAVGVVNRGRINRCSGLVCHRQATSKINRQQPTVRGLAALQVARSLASRDSRRWRTYILVRLRLQRGWT